MLLKSVEMQGFKSFADKIYLDFNPGITAIVGPNGSGKSNISDAIRWVMGEQSVKTLRGSKMEDVIFSGTQNRKPMGFAEVSLTLDNSNGFFSLDYQEITVTRRVYRSGESEYFINRVGCRLKDIHELFMDTGLGREGYSIIGQGKIDEILSNKSEDRRQIFEEAAGITKYKYRKNEAERKLNHTTENLTRIKDIMAELENQIGPLFEQSEKAKKFLKLRDELKTIEINLSVVKIDRIKNELDLIVGNLNETDAEIEKIRVQVEANEKAVNEFYEKIAEWDAEMELCRESEKDIIGAMAEANSRINVLLADIRHYEENIKKIDETVNGYVVDAENAEKQLAILEEELEKFQSIALAVKTSKEEVEKSIAEIQETSLTKNTLLEEIKLEIIEKNSEISREKERILNSKILKESFNDRKKAATAELDSKAEDYDRLKNNVSVLLDSLNEKMESVENYEKKCLDVTAKIDKKKVEQSRLALKINETDARLNKNVSKLNVLEDMEKNFDGFAGSVKAVMTATKEDVRGAKIFGPFAKLVKVSEKYTVAVDTALGNAGQNIVVRDEQDAKKIIEFLKSKKAGRATFLPVSTVKGRNLDVSDIDGMDGYIDIASNLASVDREFDAVKSSLLGAIVVVDNIDNAVKIAQKSDYKIKIVTLSGEVMQTGGAMTGGSFNKSAGFLSRSAEIENVKNEISFIEKEVDELRKQKFETDNTLELLVEELESSRLELSGLKDELIKIQADYEHGNAFLESVTAAKKQIENELLSIDESLDKINEENKNRELKISEILSEIKELETRVSSEQSGFEVLMQKSREANDKLLKISIDENSCEKDIISQKEKVSAVAETIKQYADKTEISENEKAELNEKILSAHKEIESNKNKLCEYEDTSKSAQSKLSELVSSKADAEEKIRKLQKDVTGTNDTMVGLSRQKAKLESKKTISESELEGIFSRLWDEYELTYSQAVDLADENADLTNAEKDISSLKSKIKNLGNINIDAIESYRDVKERYDFMLVQTNDLEKAKIDLEKIIAEMLTVMKTQFAQQFEIINRNFTKVFAQLFGGGIANLSLADPDNLLESGIEIEAQPPGKKLQRLSLLSGGERALTAIALLFAILNVRPTPFCILDEIEAALDDVNVNRYADYLKKYSEKAQFIVITHRRGTMESANILYGVTMQERGVSKLLSLNIDEVAK